MTISLNVLEKHLLQLLESPGLRDIYLKVPLPHQYHFGHLILSCVLFRRAGRPNSFREKILELIDHYLNLPSSLLRVCPDFNLEPIVLAHEFEVDPEVKGRLETVLRSVPSATDKELVNVRATDFYCLRYFVRNYLHRHLGIEDPELQACREGLLQLFGDGPVLVDVQSEKPAKDLAYHSRNLSILLLNSFICGDSTFDALIDSALDFAANFTSPSGRSAYYGRSMDSIYGTLSLALAFALGLQKGYGFSSDQLDRIHALFSIAENCFLSERVKVNDADDPEQRTGFDPYFYYSVYSSYGISRALLVREFLPEGTRGARTSSDESEAASFLVTSEFCRVRTTQGEVCFYLGPLPKNKIGGYSGRYLPLRPLYISREGKDLVPPPNYKTFRVNLPGKGFLTNLRKFFFRLMSSWENYINQEVFAGLTPLVFNGGSVYALSDVKNVEVFPEKEHVKGLALLKQQHAHFGRYLISRVLKRKSAVETIPFSMVASPSGVRIDYSFSSPREVGYTLPARPSGQTKGLALSLLTESTGTFRRSSSAGQNDYQILKSIEKVSNLSITFLPSGPE